MSPALMHFNKPYSWTMSVRFAASQHTGHWQKSQLCWGLHRPMLS